MAMQRTIPLFYPYMTQKIRDSVMETMQTRWLGQGPKVNEFEDLIAKKFKVKYPVALNSGTSALELAYDLVGLKPGDEVITTPYTCTATNIPLLRRGVKLVFADIRKDTMNIDPISVAKKLTRKTKAIINVNMGGIESDITGFTHGVPVITDAAQSIGLTNGDYVIYSFQAIKHFTTGDGGMLLCPDKETYKKAKLLRWFGIDREKKQRNNWQPYKKREMTFDIELPGYKYQMNDIAATMGIGGLQNLDFIIEYRKSLFDLYKEELKDVPGLQIVDGEKSVYWLMTVLVEYRDRFARKLLKAGIETNMVHIRNDIYKVFGGKRQNLPIMNELEDRYICLPLHTEMDIMDVKYICDVIQKGW